MTAERRGRTGREVRTIAHRDAAAIAGVSVRTLLRFRDEADPPPWTGEGYEVAAFGEWLRRRFRRELGVGEDGVVYDYETERARLTKAQADRTELEAAELRGDLVRYDDVVEEWSRLVSSAKARLLSLPSKVAPRARAAERDEEAARIIEGEVHEALEELATDGVPERTRSRRTRRS